MCDYIYIVGKGLTWESVWILAHLISFPTTWDATFWKSFLAMGLCESMVRKALAYLLFRIALIALVLKYVRPELRLFPLPVVMGVEN